MLVKELIEKLQKLDQEKEVYFLIDGDNPLTEGTRIGSVFELKGTDCDDGVFIKEE